MKHEGINIFDVALERLEDFEGHAVISIREEKDYADIFKFESEEEFRESFDIKHNSLYKSNMLIPKLNGEDELVIGELSYDVNEYELYHVINGELQK